MTGATGRVAALDGLRGVAILLVLVGHAANYTGSSVAVAGVTLFFALSGYLITGRLQSGQTLRRFYANRARRLLPAMLVMLAITGAFFIQVGSTPPWQVLEAGLYVRDVTVTLGAPETPWGHMWSLALEEQFYLVWPLVIGLWWRGRLLVAVGVLTFVLMRVAYASGATELAHFSPLTQAWALCLGCWLALHGQSLGGTPAWPTWLSAGLSARWLRWFGTRSYGMYLWHYPLMVAASLAMPRSVALPVGVVLGIGAAMLSWRYVEEPWLAGGRRRSVRLVRAEQPLPR